jgi:dephospho-CoA kinase
MQRIGLTGGIAAGKSVAAAHFAELGAVVIDYDQLSREAVAPGTAGLDAVAAAFGPRVLTADGALDRPALGNIVFGDDAARTTLNHIVHPVVRRLAAEREAAAAAADPDAVIVHDIPLLAESGRDDSFHLVIAIVADVELRVRRLVDGRGLSEADARARIAAQVSDDVRVAAADLVLDGTGSPEDLRAQVDELWQRIAAEREAERG